jgi:hypothetical protein
VKTIWKYDEELRELKVDKNDRYITGKLLYLQNTCSNLYTVSSYTRGADKSLARPTSRCILFDGHHISFDASLVTCINSTNIPPIMIINRIYEHQNLLSLYLVSFLVGLSTYQHHCKNLKHRALY